MRYNEEMMSFIGLLSRLEKRENFTLMMADGRRFTFMPVRYGTNLEWYEWRIRIDSWKSERGGEMRIKYTAVIQMKQERERPRSAIRPYLGADVRITNENSVFYGMKGLVFAMEGDIEGCWIAFNSDYKRQAFLYFNDMEVL